MKTKSLRTFIKENRADIDAAITYAQTRYDPPEFKRVIRLNDEERRQWVLNDEGLYNWARSEGVNI